MTTLMLPDRARLREEYNIAIRDIAATREGNIDYTKGFYAQTGSAVFEACYHALTNSHNRNSGHEPKLTVLPAPVGSGKTTFTTAFIIAMTRLQLSNKHCPYGAVFVTEQISGADAVYRTLAEHLPGKVAIWTSDHDAGRQNGSQQKVKQPAARHYTDELPDYPVVVVTQSFFKGRSGHKALRCRRDGSLIDRALIIVDEQPKDIAVYEVTHADVAVVYETVENHEEAAAAVAPLKALLDFVHCKMLGDATLEKPKDDPETWAAAAEALDWFNSPAAKTCSTALQSLYPTQPIEQVFGFGNTVATDQAFIRRYGIHGGPTRFVGYERDLMLHYGMVLLDATADVDGLTQVCAWREHVPAPRARYDRLEIVHVPSCVSGNLSRYLKTSKNRRVYADHTEQVIKEHMKPGERGLVVCKKVLIDNQNVPTWPHDDPRWDSPETSLRAYSWDVEGRQLAVTYWGGYGIGANDWQDASVVFLFDEFIPPTHVSIGTTQGLKGAKANEGPLGTMGKSIVSRSPEVHVISEGHALRYIKQMALRGNARHFDEEGICGAQKLVCVGDFERLAANVGRMFPGASPIRTEHSCTDDRQELGIRVLAFLQKSTENTIPVKEISNSLNVKWPKVSTKLLKRPRFIAGLEALGWAYRPVKGRKGSFFERISKTPISGTLSLPMAA
jgi:hypothetical protein